MAEQDKTSDWQLLKRVFRLSIPYKNIFILCTLTALILIPLNILRPKIIEDIVDNHIANQDLVGMNRMFAIYLLILLGNVIFRYFFIYYTNFLGQSIIRDLRTRVFQKIVNFRSSFFDRTPIGKFTTRTISDVEAINRIFTEGLITIISESLMILAAFGFLFYTSWILGLICLVLLPVLIGATYIFKEKVKVAFNVVRNELSEMNSFVQERISGIKIVQIFAAENQEFNKFKKINKRYTDANLNTVYYYSIFFPFVELIYALSLALMVWIGTKNIFSGYVTYGELVAFPIYLNMLYRPIRLLADRINTLQMGLVASERVFRLLDTEEHIEDQGDLIKEVQGKIEFKNVQFAYKEDDYVLHDINFHINPGETLAIVGATGSGKSTIINLLTRLYEHQKGHILIDDTDIEKYDLTSLRENIAVILQDVFLFSGSVLDNIRMRNPNISESEVKEAAEIIGADEFISELPGGYNFEVRERGSTLSMGQRQLISFVRALVYDPKVLILDEATSSIDPESEAIIQHAIEKLIRRRTSIIIAHRLSTIRHADKIIVLEKGKIVEIGHPSELMEKPEGYFKKLYEKQLETAGKSHSS
jgi:ATP-binding cassette subfamily B protein